MSSQPRLHDDEWITELFGRHSKAVLAYARRRLDSADDAEDVVVEVFATAWRRAADVPEEALPWLYATAANVIAHVIRSDARRTRLGTRLAAVHPIRDEANDDPADAIVDATDARAAVAAALDDLSEADAELIRLWAWEQLDGDLPSSAAPASGAAEGSEAAAQGDAALLDASLALLTAFLQAADGDAEVLSGAEAEAPARWCQSKAEARTSFASKHVACENLPERNPIASGLLFRHANPCRSQAATASAS